MLCRQKDDVLNHYDYLREVHEGNDESYRRELELRREQYITALKSL